MNAQLQPGTTTAVEAGDTISLLDLLELSNNERLGRAVTAAERTAEAAGRQADAMEALVALFASCMGTAYAWCPGRTEGETPTVNFLRASSNGQPFKCDQAGSDDNDE